MGEGGGKGLWAAPSEQFSLCVLRLGFALVLCVQLVSARRYVVGDDLGWNTGINYSTWTAAESFFVGDTLYFDYLEADHNVLQVDYEAFKTCNITAAIANYTAGDSIVELASTGIYYFVCGIADRCMEGQKLQVCVYFHYAADAPGSLTPAIATGYLPSFSAPDQSASPPSLPVMLPPFLLFGCFTLPLVIAWHHAL